MLRETLKKMLALMPAKRPIFTAIRGVWRPPFYKSLRFSGPFKVALGNGTYIRLNHPRGYGIETEWFWRGIAGWEAVSIQVWMNLCRGLSPGGVIFDVGACEGIYALVSKALVPSSRVIAIEALPQNFHRLRENIELNGYDIEAVEIACSEGDGQGTLFASGEDSFNEASLIPNRDRDSAAAGLTVRTRSLDSLVEERALDSVDLVKIDVEGAEPDVLRGMASTLRRFRPTMLVEILTSGAGVLIDQIMEPLGYDYFDINDHPGKGPLTISRAARISKGISLNWLLVPAEKIERQQAAWERFISKS
ncbi:MAG TPA: FkbM family methyltransferase [Chthoniobacterales bacterium]